MSGVRRTHAGDDERQHTECNLNLRTNFGHKSHPPKQEKKVHNNMCPETFNLCYSSKSAFIICVQNVLHEIQCTP
jgi:hypothetical protein